MPSETPTPCLFVPPHEPFYCRIHADVRLALTDERCRRAERPRGRAVRKNEAWRAEHGESRRGNPAPIDLDAIEMRWASQWNESDDGEVRAWRDDVAALIDEVRRLRHVSPAERLAMYQSMYLDVAAKWAAMLDAADKAEDAQPDEVIEALASRTPATPDALREAAEDMDRFLGWLFRDGGTEPPRRGYDDVQEALAALVWKHGRNTSVPAPTLDAHPGQPHEFETVCKRCGENGYLHVAVITDLEVVKVEAHTNEG